MASAGKREESKGVLLAINGDGGLTYTLQELGFPDAANFRGVRCDSQDHRRQKAVVLLSCDKSTLDYQTAIEHTVTGHTMRSFLSRQWFLISLFILICLGFACPAWFEPLSQAKFLRNCVVAVVLFVMALPLDTKSVRDSIRRPWPALVASLVNVGVLPLVTWMLVPMLSNEDMRRGLLVTAAVPCTLASAAVWTRRAGGDDTVAILVTTITNLTCFLTIPFWLYLTLGSELTAEDQARLVRMPLRLGMLVVAPMTLAQILRQRSSIGDWATRNKSHLSKFAQVGILIMVLSGATVCGLKLADTSVKQLSGVVPMALLALTLHLIVFFIGFRLAGWLGFSRPQQIASGIAGSQKTLMVGLDIAITYVGGLAILPMVTYHIIQLLADTVIADRLSSGNS